MPQSRIFRLSTYPFHEAESILFDANIWLYLYPPPSGAHNLPAAYSSGFKRALAAKSKIVLDVLVLSEYLNAYTRKEWADSQDDSGLRTTFKQFRSSALYLEKVGPTAAYFAKKMLTHAELTGVTLDRRSADAALAAFQLGELDSNDAILAELCRENDWRLVTHDGDFRHVDIDVLSENPKLLRS